MPKKLHHRVENLKIGETLSFSSRESYNLLRTNLYLSLPNENGMARAIGITSACPQEGKSYTAINLAYMLAKDGKRVLLIDGDMRKPTVARKLGLKNRPGFSNLLANQDTEVIHQNTLIEGLDIIMAGDTPPNPNELLGSQRLKDILDAFRTMYDYIVFDLPPVNIVSDALVVSPYLDGIAIAVRHNFSTKREITECVSKLQFAKVHILGYIYRGYTHRTRYYRKRRYYKDNSYYSYYSYYAKDEKKKK